MAHALTIDFECWPQIACLYATGQVRDLGGDGLERQTDRVLGLLARRDVKATFFVLGITARAWPRLVERLAAEGHGIACHGFGHARVDTLEPADLASDLERARELLASLTGQRPKGYRAPEFSITRRASAWALDVIADAGFSYDSSIYPFAGRRYGIWDWPRVPGPVASGRLQELPLATWPLAGVNIPVAGGGYWRLLPDVLLASALDRMAHRGECAVLYLHPFELDDRDPPPVGGHLTARQRLFAGRFRLQQRTGRSSVFRKLSSLLERYEWVTAATVACAGEAG